MELTVIGTGSSGNGYILQNETEALIIECGMPLKDAKKSLGWNLSKVSGAIVSHRHNDHAGHVVDYANAGIPILALSDVIESKKLDRNCQALYPGNGYAFGRFKVMPFMVEHDVPCVGFLISHPECGRVLFVTDTYVVGHRMENGQMHLATFRDINHWLIEANYTTWIVDRNIKSGGRMTPQMKERLLMSHLSLGNCIKTLLRHDLSRTKDITLIHMSDGNSDEKLFVKRVRDATGKRVIPARAGLTIDYNMDVI